ASYRAREEQRPVEGSQHRPAAQDVVARALDLLEDAQPALDRGTDLESDAPGQRTRKRLSGKDHGARTLDLEGEQGAPCRIAALLGDVALADAVTRHFVLREVDAAVGEIDLHVL